MSRPSHARESLPLGVEVDLVEHLESLPPAVCLANMVARVAPMIGRARRHPVLVGPSEVGKTALVHALARSFESVWQVSLRTLDSMDRGDHSVASLLCEILHEATESPRRPVVFVRDLWALRRFDAEHDLVTALARLDVRFLGEAWPPFHAWVSDNADLAAVCHVVRVDEPDADAVDAMLHASMSAERPRHDALWEGTALAHVRRLAERLLPSRRMPGKAFSLLDAVSFECARDAPPTVTPARVTAHVRESLRLPAELVAPDVPLDVGALAARLNARVVGQEEAVDAVVGALARHKADLAPPGRPIATVLLAGPSGVGKTLLARAVAEEVFGSPDRLVRVPMGEHAEDWKVELLFGQRNGTAVEAKRGLLARRLAGRAYAVVLLDEVEKAPPLAFRHLLRPLDEGAYVNGNDEEVSLANTLWILAANVDDESVWNAPVGFGAQGGAQYHAGAVLRRLRESLSPELLDRIDHVIVCPPRGDRELREMARRAVDGLVTRPSLLARGITVTVDDAVIERVVRECDPRQGARAVQRAVERHVAGPLAAQVARASLPPGSHVHVAVDDVRVARDERLSRSEPPAVVPPRAAVLPFERAQAQIDERAAVARGGRT